MILSGDILVLTKQDFDELANGRFIDIPERTSRIIFKQDVIDFLDEMLYAEEE